MATSTDRIFISAGEASGDSLGSCLVREIASLARDVQFEGIGSARMQDAGVKLVASSKDWGAISITQSLRVLPRGYRGFRKAAARLRQGDPGLFIAIDFGFFNVRLEREAKQAGWKTLYFMPPGSWKRREHVPGSQPSALAVLSDAVVTPFQWSKDFLEAQGAKVFWFGHPVLQMAALNASTGADSPTAAALDQREKFLAVLPGSRSHELEANLPLFAQVIPDSVPAKFVVAPSVSLDALKAHWHRLAPHRNDEFLQLPALEVMKTAHAALIVSGTASLEGAVAGCPMAVVYRVTPVMRFEATLIGFKRPQFVALPNIILEEMAIPELIGDEATPGACREVLDRIWSDDVARKAQADAFARIRIQLGYPHAITETARLALSMLRT